MASDWPDGWVTAALKDAGLPVTDFTTKIMYAWNRSTPILPYTNNPLGMPAVKGKTLELMKTGYAMFVTMGHFRSAFAGFINSHAGQDVRDAFHLSDKFSEAYRAIHSLKWPANTTETDWPSAVLDLTSEAYRNKAASVASASDRKTSGFLGTQTGMGDLAGGVGRSAAAAITSIQQATNAVQRLPGRLS